ncbi:hypothetical protein LXL04_026878 [Taraxacum kok-saghyz]
MEQLLHVSNLIRRKWHLCFLLVSIFSEVASSPTPQANLLCISECGTCPLICSPPPAPPAQSKPPPLPIESKPPPSPPVQSKPPPADDDDSEPPPYLTPIYHATPPPTPPTSSSPPWAKSCPPPSYITMGTNAPPPPPRLVVVPSTQIPTVDQKNFSYPYYYFYTSKGVTFSHDFSVFIVVFASFYFIFLLLG